jgi:RecQ family ATP-dependent DNA helicase
MSTTSSYQRYAVRDMRPDMPRYQEAWSRMPGVLHDMGYSSLRKGQVPVVNNMMLGRDTVAILPTACHAPGQEILMADGSLKKVEDIVVGDMVMGWDGTAREVTHTKHGRAPCSRIKPYGRASFVVTDQHLLTLTTKRGEILDVSVQDYNRWSRSRKRSHYLFCVPVGTFHRSEQTPNEEDLSAQVEAMQECIPSEFKYSHILCRRRMLGLLLWKRGQRTKYGYDFETSHKQLADDVVFVARSIGCNVHVWAGGAYSRLYISGEALGGIHPDLPQEWPEPPLFSRHNDRHHPFYVKAEGEQEFYGITITGDGRYLMGDFMVTHNTGKTLCFAAVTKAQKWKTLVFSPLISLMRDQQQSLSRKGVDVGSITSKTANMTPEYYRRWLSGDLDLLYVAPERLLREDFLNVMRQAPPDCVVVDEAHTLSQWSMTFRSAYCCIGDFITMFNPKLVAAFSATLPHAAEQDVRRVLCIDKADRVVYYPRRTNLDLRSTPWVDLDDLANRLKRINGPSIIYCATREGTEKTALALTQITGREVGYYHGDMKDSLRSNTQDRFVNGDLDWICATNAFGMGVDHQDIRAVFHKDHAGCMEAQAQETGRAGRSGKYALCMTFYGPEALKTQQFFIRTGNPMFSEVRAVYNVIKKLADRGGNLTIDRKLLSEKAGVSFWSMAPIMEILYGADAVSTTKKTDKMVGVRFKNRVDDPRFNALHEVVSAAAVDDGWHQITLEELASNLQVQEGTVRARLRDYEKQGLIDYEPADRTRPLQLKGDLSRVDAARVDALRREADAKLDQVLTYCRYVPDHEKHKFIEDFLEVTAVIEQ